MFFFKDENSLKGFDFEDFFECLGYSCIPLAIILAIHILVVVGFWVLLFIGFGIGGGSPVEMLADSIEWDWFWYGTYIVLVSGAIIAVLFAVINFVEDYDMGWLVSIFLLGVTVLLSYLTLRVQPLYNNVCQYVTCKDVFKPVLENITTLIEHPKNSSIIPSDTNKVGALLAVIRHGDKGTFEICSEDLPGFNYRTVYTKADSIKWIIAITRDEIFIRRYTNFSCDYQWLFKVCLLSWPDGVLVASNSFKGSIPESRSGAPATSRNESGSEPWLELSSWLVQLGFHFENRR